MGFFGNYFLHQKTRKNPDAQLSSKKQGLNDFATNGESINQLLHDHNIIPHTMHDPSMGENDVALKSGRNWKEVASATLADSVLSTSLKLSKMKESMAKLEATGKVAYNEDYSVIAFTDPYENRVRAFKRIHSVQDNNTPYIGNENATGFMAGAFAELEVAPMVTSAKQFVETRGSILGHLEFSKDTSADTVRIILQGYEFNREGAASIGQLDRGEMPNQLARVLPFLQAAHEEMQRIEIPAGSHVAITGHSMGATNALSAVSHWENNSEFQDYKLGHVAMIAPAGAALGARHVATLTAAVKTVKGENTSVEDELRKLTSHVDVITVEGDGLTQFATNGLTYNSKGVGTNEFQIQLQKTSKLGRLKEGLANHTVTGLSQRLLSGVSETALLKEVGDGRLADPHIIAHSIDNPAPQVEPLKDSLTRTVGNALLAFRQKQNPYEHGDEKYLTNAVRDIGKSLKALPEEVDKVVIAAQIPKVQNSGKQR